MLHWILYEHIYRACINVVNIEHKRDVKDYGYIMK